MVTVVTKPLDNVSLPVEQAEMISTPVLDLELSNNNVVLRWIGDILLVGEQSGAVHRDVNTVVSNEQNIQQKYDDYMKVQEAAADFGVLNNAQVNTLTNYLDNGTIKDMQDVLLTLHETSNSALNANPAGYSSQQIQALSSINQASDNMLSSLEPMTLSAASPSQPVMVSATVGSTMQSMFQDMFPPVYGTGGINISALANVDGITRAALVMVASSILLGKILSSQSDKVSQATNVASNLSSYNKAIQEMQNFYASYSGSTFSANPKNYVDFGNIYQYVKNGTQPAANSADAAFIQQCSQFIGVLQSIVGKLPAQESSSKDEMGAKLMQEFCVQLNANSAYVNGSGNLSKTMDPSLFTLPASGASSSSPFVVNTAASGSPASWHVVIPFGLTASSDPKAVNGNGGTNVAGWKQSTDQLVTASTALNTQLQQTMQVMTGTYTQITNSASSMISTLKELRLSS